jgi:enterochelin esterase-like enzyme
LISRRAPADGVIARLRGEGPTPEAIDRLLAENPVPVVEGSSCTFVWRGQADAVAIEHRVVGLPAPLALRRLPGSDIWYATVTLPRGARVEYRVLIRRGTDVESVLDPLNPREATGPLTTASVLEAEGYATPPWAIADPAVVPGALTDVTVPSRHLKRDVRVNLYAPARAGKRDRVPLVIVHDGTDYLKYAGMGTVLDNLMGQRLMADSVVAFVDPADRFVEYGASLRQSRFLTKELVPKLERTLPVRSDPAGRVLVGASLGAIAALTAATQAPGFYGGLLLQSATFVYSMDGLRAGMEPKLDSVVKFVEGIRANPPRVADRIFQSIGAFEPSAARNRAMAATLRAMATHLLVEEGLDGHTWIGWRDRLLDGLTWLLPGEARTVHP